MASEYITDHASKQVLNAFQYAEEKGTPINTYITITPSKLSAFDPATLPYFITQLFHRLGKWLRKSHVEPAYFYTLENSSRFSSHIHAAIHVPRHLFASFRAAFPSFLLGYKGEPHVWEISGNGLRWHISQRRGLLRYWLKGMDHSKGAEGLAAELGICPDPRSPDGQQGTITGARRCGVSHALGIRARQRAGYRERREVSELTAIL